MQVVLVRVQLLPPHEAHGVVIQGPGVGGQRRVLRVATPAANTGNPGGYLLLLDAEA